MTYVIQNRVIRTGDTMTGLLKFKDGPVYDVRAFGAVADGTTDDYAAINSAISAAIADGGGTVLLAPGVSAIATAIVINSNQVKIVGAGAKGYPYVTALGTTGSSLKWTGGAGGTMITFATLAAHTVPIWGGGLEGVSLEGNNSAGIGLLVKSTYGQAFDDLRVNDCTTVGIKLDVTTPMDVGGAFACQDSIFRRITVRQVDAASGDGIVLTGPGTADTGNASFNRFELVEVVHKNGTGIELGDSDSNVFQNVRCTRAAAGTGLGVDLLGSTDATEGHARANIFVALDAGLGGLTSRNNTGAARNNTVWGYYKENSAPDPTIESGSTLNWTTETGIVNTIGDMTITKASGALAVEAKGNGQNSLFRTSVWAAAPTQGPVFQGRRMNGSIAAPRRTQTNNVLATFGGTGGYAADDATDATLLTTYRAAMRVLATENWTSTGQGTKIDIPVTAIGATTAATILALGHDGTNPYLQPTDTSAVFLYNLGSTNGTRFGASGDKIGFFGTTPIVKPTSTTDLRTALINLGLYTSGGATPLNLNGGALTAGATQVGTLAATDTITITDAKNIVLNTTTGTKIGTATTQKLAFFNSTPVVQQANTVKARAALETYGLLAAGGAEERVVQLKVLDDATNLSTGDGKLIFCISDDLNGLNLIDADCFVTTVATGATLVTVQVRNITQAADMLTTRMTIDASEFTSYTAATPPVIDTANDDVATGDLIAIDIDAIGNTTPGKGLGVILTFGL